MQVTKGTWRMREQCVPGSLSSSPAQEPGNEARLYHTIQCMRRDMVCIRSSQDPSLLLQKWVRLARLVYHHACDKRYQALSLFGGKSLIMRLAKYINSNCE